MSTTGTSSPALAKTSSRVPTAVTRPSSMRSASATAGSPSVRIRPTMASVPVWRVVVLGAALLAAVVAGALIPDEAGDAGELVLFGAHPITRATTTAKTGSEAGSRMRGVELGAVIGMDPSRLLKCGRPARAERASVYNTGEPGASVLVQSQARRRRLIRVERRGRPEGRPPIGLDQCSVRRAHSGQQRPYGEGDGASSTASSGCS